MKRISTRPLGMQFIVLATLARAAKSTTDPEVVCHNPRLGSPAFGTRYHFTTNDGYEMAQHTAPRRNHWIGQTWLTILLLILPLAVRAPTEIPLPRQRPDCYGTGVKEFMDRSGIEEVRIAYRSPWQIPTSIGW